jgi:transcriptional regulator with XRE-family HTH domain
MADPGDEYTSIDQHIATNLRAYREADSFSQEELAQRMTDRGFGFTQATIWKIESGQRPVRASELVALADCFGGVITAMSFTREPGGTRHRARLRKANRQAYGAYQALKEAAAAYIEVQIELAFAAYEAHNDGVTLTELDTTWLDMPPEEAAIEARIAADEAAGQSQNVAEAVGKVRDALRAAGYEPTLRIEDIKVGGGGPLPVWTPERQVGPAE